MAIENVGPGGVGNNYGVRETVARERYELDKEYIEEYTDAYGVVVTSKVDPVTGGSIFSSGDAKVFTGPPLTVEDVSITLGDAHNERVVRCTSVDAVTVTIPAGYPGRFETTIIQAGSGDVTVVGDAGVTIEGDGTAADGYRVISITKTGDDTYLVVGSGMPVFAFAGLPSAAQNIGMRAQVSDLGGSVWRSTGASWVSENGTAVVAQGGNLTAPADTAENVLATITIPGHALGAGGVLDIETLWSFVGSGATNKTTRVRLGGAAGTAFLNLAHTTALSYSRLVRIAADASEAAQFSMAGNSSGGTGSTTVAPVVGAIDMTQDQTVVISAQKETSGDVMRLVAYRVLINRIS